MNLLLSFSLALLLSTTQAIPRQHFAHPTFVQQTDTTTVKVNKIAPGLWVHTSYHLYKGTLVPSNGLIIKSGEELILIDTAWGVKLSKRLLGTIKKQIGLPIQYAIVTHFHADRIAGTNLLEKLGIPVYAHPLTQKLAKKVGNPVPNLVISKIAQPGTAIQMDNIEMFYPGPGHTADNIVIWVPEQQILYGGCLIRNMQTTTLGNTTDANLKSWPKAIKRIQKNYSNIQIVVPGHGNIGSSELLDHMFKLFNN